uniref:Uncharacterized protein LOC104224085 n=1 Tax=Nicotiana sylvestris TaxID=4096 RepID=A0A1U7WH39_NICSY|nr:PREDICTED: uncharacterized protein LOC104224085 [Nicotiana sylvestris]
MEISKIIDTPISTATRLDIDEPGSSVNETMYRGIIGSLLFLTASGPDIAAKRIIKYLKEKQDLVLYYPSGDNFDLIWYADDDYAGYLLSLAVLNCCGSNSSWRTLSKQVANVISSWQKDEAHTYKRQLSQAQEAPGSSSAQGAEIARLTKENADIRKQVEDLKERLLNEQVLANAQMDILLRTLASSSLSPPSSAP